ncbi:MAG: serine hydrolase domain-containing protein [Bacteroidota bacterium]
MNKIILILLSILTWSQAIAQTNSDSRQIAKVDSLLQVYTYSDEPGLALGIIKNGEVIYQNAIGIADLSHHIPISDSTTFNIASVSKQFTALAALIAEEEGKLSLQDEIKKYLPELKHLPYPITIQQLANHTHGLPNYSDLIEMIGFGLASPIPNDQAVATMLEIKQVNFEPGTQFQYGNSGFMLLAEILKRVYEKPFPELMQEKVFEPLALDQTAVIDHPNTIIPRKALPYTSHGDTYVEYPSRLMESGSANIHTTLNDLVTWATNFQKPRAGTQQKLARLMTETVSLIEESEYGYGLGLFTELYKGMRIIFHGGGTAGYRAYILHVPDHNLSIVTLGNQDRYDALLIVKDLLKLYLKEYMVEQVPSKTAYTSEEMRAFEGTFKFHPGQYWTFTTDGKDLYFSGLEAPLPLIGDGKFEFFLPTSYLTFNDSAMELRVADFTYHCPRVKLDPPSLSIEELSKYSGIFRNEEFNTYYELLVIKDKLVAKHLTNGEIPLSPLSKDRFYAGYPLGEFEFQLDASGEVMGFKLSGQNYYDIQFMKLK